MTDEPARLPWQRHEGGFITYPDGPHNLRRFATVMANLVLPVTNRWVWTIHCDGASMNGTNASKQEAADCVTANWPRAVQQAAVLEAQAQRRRRWLAQIEQAASETDPDVAAIFAISTADQESLSWIMDQVRHRTRTPGLTKLIDVVSRELYKFRTGERR